MESIKSAMEQFMKNRDFMQQYDTLKEQLYEDRRIQAFLKEHPTVTTEVIERSLTKLFEFKGERTNCDACPGLDACKNMIQGYQPELIEGRGRIELQYNPCELKRKYDERKQQQELIKSLHVPKEILQASFDQLDQDNERMTASAAALEFAINAQPGEDGRGLYFYGQFGVGKTYIMGAIAQELADRNIETLLVYTPDFFREIKNSLGDGTFNEKIEKVKRAQVLILDDIGAENMSSWIRDEVLGVILQYRMMEKLPTLYTSNYDLDELEEHLSYSEKGGIEQLKAKRIMERIRHYTKPIFIKGRNRRS
ncbi:primosomal protein DnaI [Desertibacillus haloalkaliphilus]|uniref:primosomal protein DnaI n=1 Tax=Desertibacillus haloalkaliphilus TaxID=1328930 RepID=UPI001C26C5DB|nr:primosomal protein DnaI [Desertibacillus haloalkaliphilus]MBU8905139.1 primosomal protein DnaI [Desertibacillus haloalkaliphilus]